ncbi:MAG: nuclear transport factor 2 family protein [Hyphomicrobium sp.]
MNKTTQQTALQALQSFVHSWESRDIEALINHLSQTKQTVMFGSGVDEKLIGKEEIKKQILRDWQQSDSASLVLLWNLLESSGSVSWISSDVGITALINDKTLKLNGRLTTVWENEDDAWRLVQWHLSTPEVHQRVGQSWPNQ